MIVAVDSASASPKMTAEPSRRPCTARKPRSIWRSSHARTRSARNRATASSTRARSSSGSIVARRSVCLAMRSSTCARPAPSTVRTAETIARTWLQLSSPLANADAVAGMARNVAAELASMRASAPVRRAPSTSIISVGSPVTDSQSTQPMIESARAVSRSASINASHAYWIVDSLRTVNMKGI